MNTNRSDLEELLRGGGAMLGITLQDHDVARLLSYLALLAKWNTRINLTATRDEREVVVQHFLDSLAVVPHIPREAERVIDVGSGAGFPGAVVALLRPDLAVVSLEPVHKKYAFQATVRRELRLANFHPLAQRLDAHVQGASFQPYDLAMSRATFALPEWLAQGARLVREGGVVLGMEGAEQYPLPEGARRYPYSLPDLERSAGARRRAVIVYLPARVS
jgi:16S rRNA (guanine527-N7)-methyltransferase